MTDHARPSKANVRDTYEAIAESFAERRREPWPEVVAFASDVAPNTRVLDVGCGHGRHAAVLAARGCRVVGIDLSRRLLAIGATQSHTWADGPPPGWIRADATALPFPEAAFSACLCIAVLHHLPTRADRKSALTEIRRILEPGGSALVSVWSADQERFDDVRKERGEFHGNARFDVFVPWHLPGGAVAKRYYHLFKEPELRRLIIESGLREENFFRGPGNLFVRATRA